MRHNQQRRQGDTKTNTTYNRAKTKHVSIAYNHAVNYTLLYNIWTALDD